MPSSPPVARVSSARRPGRGVRVRGGTRRRPRSLIRTETRAGASAAIPRAYPPARALSLAASFRGLASRLGKLPTPAVGSIGVRRAGYVRRHRGGGFLAVVKKLLVLALLGLGAFAIWRKVQSDRAELDLWTEATAADEE